MPALAFLQDRIKLFVLMKAVDLSNQLSRVIVVFE